MSCNHESDFEVLTNEDIIEFNDAGYLQLPAQILLEIQTWLAPTKYSSENSEYRKHIVSYLEGTCEWFQSTKAYRDWHDGVDVGALWIKAVAGAGKSVLAASTAARLAQQEQVPVLFFFFRQIVALNHEPKYLVRDWLSQLLPSSPWLQKKLHAYVEDKKNIDQLALDELWGLFCSALSYMPKAYCIVDALDEMDHGNEDFLSKLVALGHQNPASIKVLLTSRPVPTFENILRSQVSQIRLDPVDVDSDVDMYVKFRLKPIGGRPTFYESLGPIIRRRACGLFLYARLVTDELIEAVRGTDIKPDDIPRIVDSVPESLEDVYNKILRDHSKRSGVSQEHQLTILQWITHSTRPLRLIEAAAALKEVGSKEGSLKDTKALVRAACGPLLEVLEDETLSVIHHSFTEYLTQVDRKPSSFPVIAHEVTHRMMATICLKYLCGGALDQWKLREPFKRSASGQWAPKYRASELETGPIRALELKYQLLDYSLSNWYVHANKAGFDEALCTALDDFMRPHSHHLAAWLDIKVHRNSAHAATPMHVAAWAGTAELVRLIARQGGSTDQKDYDLRTPISVAAEGGKSEAVAELLQCGVDPNTVDELGLRPIHHAARANHHETVRLLLAAGVSALSKTSKGQLAICYGIYTMGNRTAVEFAARSGHAETMEELIPFLDEKWLHEALHWAAQEGRASVLTVLLKCSNVLVDHCDPYDTRFFKHGSTALYHATESQSPACVRVLLKHGAQTVIDTLSLSGSESNATPSKSLRKTTLLHVIAGKYQSANREPASTETVREVLKILIEAGCDLDASDEKGFSPLHYAVQGFSDDKDHVVLDLLKAGADASKRTGAGKSVFHLYRRSNVEVVHALIAAGADVDAGGDVNADVGSILDGRPGRPVLFEMVENSTEQVALAFLGYNINVHARGWKGQSVLHCVVVSTKVVKKLIELGADVNARDNSGWTPLHSLACFDCINLEDGDIVRLLLNAGADIDATDRAGRTPLFLAAHVNERLERNLEILLRLGADIGRRDIEGKSILHSWISELSRTDLQVSQERFRFLVSRHADPHVVDHYGNTLLHEAARLPWCSDHNLQTLLRQISSLGVSAEQKNLRGYTALHVAAATRTSADFEYSAFGFFLDLVGELDINGSDNYGVTALHLAASISEANVVRLVEAGADPYALTYENQSALHIACGARQSNIVGLLIRLCEKDRRLGFVNVSNDLGRTALHYAVRANRPEMVQILLEAGADVNTRDSHGRSPLDACVEIDDERVYWHPDNKGHETERLDAANIMIGDTLRPRPQQGRSIQVRSVEGESDLMRVREIVRLLVKHGADLAPTPVYDPPNEPPYQRSARDLAAQKFCRPLVEELEAIPGERRQKQRGLGSQCVQSVKRPGDELRYQLLDTRANRTSMLLSQWDSNIPAMYKEDSLIITQELLKLGHDTAVLDLHRLGWSMLNPRGSGRQGSPIHYLAEKGYGGLLEQLCIGPILQAVRDYDDLAWPYEKEECYEIPQFPIEPVLIAACSRALPNLATVKILVETLGLDINSQIRQSRKQGEGQTIEFGPGPLHILAAAECWWQREALEYLLQQKPNTEIRDFKDRTPLHVTLHNEQCVPLYRKATVKTLLEHGADPNAVDGEGKTCLELASSSPDLMRLLAGHGARVNDPKRPPLISAIRSNNPEAVRVLLEAGADVNAPRVTSDSEDEVDKFSLMYPICEAMTPSKLNEKDRPLEPAITVSKLLLENGVDLYKILADGSPIVNHLIQKATFFEPILTHSGLQLEYQDPRGRTLLLAACWRSWRYDARDKEVEVLQKLLQDLIELGADTSAVDKDGQGLLHALVQSDTWGTRHVLVDLFTGRYPNLVSVRDNAGHTPLHHALRLRRYLAARILVDAGADLLDVDEEGNTSLHWLANRAGVKDSLFEQSLSLGIDINTRNNGGRTPLASYLRTTDLGKHEYPYKPPPPLQTKDEGEVADIIRNDIENCFLGRGADVFAIDKDGKGLLHIIAGHVPRVTGLQQEKFKSCADEIFQFFVDKGLDPRLEDKGQMTPLDVASVMGNEVILKMFRKDK